MQMDGELTIRRAEAADAHFVASCVLAAVDLYDFETESVEREVADRVCARRDTLYSYLNARIAEVGGRPVGCLVSYDGAIYAEARRVTFGMFSDVGRAMDDTEMETGPGEYYLDSMAIVPQFRGAGIGLRLLTDAMQEARRQGFTRFSLIVEKSKPRLRGYYEGLGFAATSELTAFGDVYFKMVKED